MSCLDPSGNVYLLANAEGSLSATSGKIFKLDLGSPTWELLPEVNSCLGVTAATTVVKSFVNISP